jgi:hypothetical protein
MTVTSRVDEVRLGVGGTPAGVSGVANTERGYDSPFRGGLYAVLFSLPAWTAVSVTIMNFAL